MKKTPARAPLATTLHRIQAERARPRRVSTRIHTHDPANTAAAIRRLARPQPSASPASSAKRTRTGTQVTAESRASSTVALPRTYSTRVNGRERYRGRAPLTRSGETSTGATHAVSRKARLPWKVRIAKKKSALRTKSGADDISRRARAAGL
jgi:hypothetical protein